MSEAGDTVLNIFCVTGRTRPVKAKTGGSQVSDNHTIGGPI